MSLMKPLTIFLLALCCVSASAQIGNSFGQGSVVFATNPPQDEWVDFALCCGQPGSYGYALGGSFDYQPPMALNSIFNLVFTGPGICEEGCVFSANFAHWYMPVLVNDGGYTQGAALKNGLLTTPYHVWTGVNAMYSQSFYKMPGEAWSADGNLTVFLK